MLDLTKYDSLGAALRDALARWPDEVCLIEADREREKSRLTYRQFQEAAEPLAAALEDSGFSAGDRAAIIMTNQPKWLISAYAVFFSGGVVVPLDYKLSAAEHLQFWRIPKPACCLSNIRCGARSRRPRNFTRSVCIRSWSRKLRRTPILRAACAGRIFMPTTRRNSGRARGKTRPASCIRPALEAARKAAC